MKYNRKITALLTAIFCFALLFPAVHAVDHFLKDFGQKHCKHKYHIGEDEISHAHFDYEKCFKCEFRISPYTPLNWDFPIKEPRETFFAFHSFPYICFKVGFTGLCKSLRAPPAR